MAKSYFYDEGISDWRELVKGEQGEQGPVGPRGPQGPAIDIETGLPISVDTTDGTTVTIGDTKVYDEALQPSFEAYTPSLEDGVEEISLRVTALAFGALKIVTIMGGFRHAEERQILFTVRAEHRPRNTITVTTYASGTQFTQRLRLDGTFRNWSERTQDGWAYINITYITDRT